MDYQGHRILPFDVMVNSHLITTSKLSSTTGMAKKPLVRLPMLSSPLSSTSPEDSQSSKLLAKDNQVVFPVELEDLSLSGWIYPSQKRAWLDCLSLIVGG